MTNFNSNDIRRLDDMLTESRNIVITCHLCPDGDALGSSLGLYNTLRNLNPGAKVTVVTPDEPTRNLAFLPGYTTIIPYSRYKGKAEKLIAGADLIVCLDYNALMRVDLLAQPIKESKAAKVLIDHHIDPENFADITFSFPGKCATCMLLFEILEAAGKDEYINVDAANCLLAGMMTDTGDFAYNVNDPETYNAIGRLIAKGADKARLTRILFNTFSEENLRIQGFALAERMDVFAEMHAALIVLTRNDLNRFKYRKGDTEGLVNKPLAIPGILYSCYLREETDYIKVSMRSLGNLPVNEICSKYFNGGGHLNAAGGEFYGSMEDCIITFRNSLKENFDKYIKDNKILSEVLKDEL